MAMFKYRCVITTGPNGTVFRFRAADGSAATEVAELDGWHYVHVPEDEAIPEQHAEIEWTAVTVTDDLITRLRAHSPFDAMIRDGLHQRIRAVYSADDEHYFARIASTAALGSYELQPGEQDELTAFVRHVESARAWAHAERVKIGLKPQS